MIRVLFPLPSYRSLASSYYKNEACQSINLMGQKIQPITVLEARDACGLEYIVLILCFSCIV